MRRTLLYIILVALAIVPGLSQIKNGFYAPPPGQPKNVIILVARNLSAGGLSATELAKKGKLNLSQMSVAGYVRPYFAENGQPDMAALATALATGVEAPNGSLGVDANGKPLRNILEWAKAKKMATGLVATGSVTDVVPAAFTLHMAKATDPDNMAIAFAKTRWDYVLGTSASFFDKRKDKVNLLQPLAEEGYELESKQKRVGKFRGNKIMAILDEKDIFGARSRGDYLTKGVTNGMEVLLSNPMGFMLVADASKTQAAAKEKSLSYMVEELKDFDDMVGEVINRVGRDNATLVLVVGLEDNNGLTLRNPNANKGTAEAVWATEGPSANLLPVFAHGPGSEAFRGVQTHAQLFEKLKEYLELRKY